MDKDPNISIEQNQVFDFFRKATWPEALDFAANGLKKISNESSGKKIAGFGSAKCSNEEAYLFQ